MPMWGDEVKQTCQDDLPPGSAVLDWVQWPIRTMAQNRSGTHGKSFAKTSL